MNNDTIIFKTLGEHHRGIEYHGYNGFERYVEAISVYLYDKVIELSKSAPYKIERNVLIGQTNMEDCQKIVRHWIFWKKAIKSVKYTTTSMNVDTLSFNDNVYILKIYDKDNK